MRISEAFPSKYVKAADLAGQSHVVTMAGVKVEEIDDDGTTKPVLYFEARAKGLVLNKTNAAVIAKHYGDETDAWAGKTIELYPADVQFKAEVVEAVRVRVPRPQPTEAASSF